MRYCRQSRFVTSCSPGKQRTREEKNGGKCYFFDVQPLPPAAVVTAVSLVLELTVSRLPSSRFAFLQVFFTFFFLIHRPLLPYRPVYMCPLFSDCEKKKNERAERSRKKNQIEVKEIGENARILRWYYGRGKSARSQVNFSLSMTRIRFEAQKIFTRYSDAVRLQNRQSKYCRYQPKLAFNMSEINTIFFILKLIKRKIRHLSM